MKVKPKNKRLKAVKPRFMLLPTKCESCHQEIYFEKMWKVSRWGMNQAVCTWHYCKNCMHSAEEVLKEVDTDDCPWGLAYIDPFFGFTKKDNTRLMERFNESKPRPPRTVSMVKSPK